MKKVLFLVMLCIGVFAFARKVLANWTSTCGISHSATFTGNWTNVQIAEQISLINEVECGVPVTVNFN